MRKQAVWLGHAKRGEDELSLYEFEESKKSEDGWWKMLEENLKQFRTTPEWILESAEKPTEIKKKFEAEHMKKESRTKKSRGSADSVTSVSTVGNRSAPSVMQQPKARSSRASRTSTSADQIIPPPRIYFCEQRPKCMKYFTEEEERDKHSQQCQHHPKPLKCKWCQKRWPLENRVGHEEHENSICAKRPGGWLGRK